jgi:iron complex outermembrane recepter protein
MAKGGKGTAARRARRTAAAATLIPATTTFLSAVVASSTVAADSEKPWEDRLRQLEQGGSLRAGFTLLQVAQAGSRTFDIPPQPLMQALARFTRETGIAVDVAGVSAGTINSPGARGRFTDEEALRQLLAGTGLAYRFTSSNAATLVSAAPEDGEVIQLNPVTVEATGAPPFGDPPPDEGFKPDYQVGATKSPTTLRETPQSVTVITQQSIEDRQVKDINSALELSAGASAGNSSGGGPFAGPSPRVADQFSLRGQRLDGDRDVRIDGFSAGAMRNDYDLASFERVEVVKGPSSMLYGEGSLGGFINLVRKKPREEFFASASGTVGSYDTYRTEGDITGPFEETGSLLGRMTFAYDNSGSFIDHVESELFVAAPALELRVEEDTRILVQGIYQKEKFQPSVGIPLKRVGNELKIPDVRRSLYFGVPASEESTTEEAMASVRVDHQVTDRWLATLQLQRSANMRRGLADNYGYEFLPGGDAFVYSSITEHETDVWAGELRVDGAFDLFGLEHKLVSGLEYNRRSQDSRSGYMGLGMANIYDDDSFEDVGTFPAGDLPITFDNTSESRNKSVYLQLSLGLTERTRLLAGVRHDRTQQSVHDNISDTGNKKKDAATTFRAGLTHDFTDNLTAYASYAQSFSPVSDVAASGEVLDPETGEGYEVGLKSEWFDDKLLATLAVFRQELDNVPITDPNNGPNDNFSINAGLQRTRGVEAEIAGSFYPGFTVGAAATYLDSEYIDKRDPNYGLTPDETVDWQSAVYLSYEIQDGEFQGLGFGGTWVHVGARYSIDADGENVHLDGYDRFDLHAYYRGIENVDLSFQVRNLLDARYIERDNGAFGYGHYFGAPRSFLFQGQVNF